MARSGLTRKRLLGVRAAQCVVGVICAAGVSSLALAQNYPLKPVRLVTGFPAGGGIDIMARLLAPKMIEALGQQFIIDSRPGAGANMVHVPYRGASPSLTALVGGEVELTIANIPSVLEFVKAGRLRPQGKFVLKIIVG